MRNWSHGLPFRAAAALEAAPHLGEALLRGGLIEREELARALALQRQPGPHRPIGRILVDIGALSELQLRMALAEWLGVRVIDPKLLAPEAAALALVPRALAEREGVLPLMLQADGTRVVLVADPWDRTLLDELRFVSQRRVLPVMAVPGTLLPAVHRAYPLAQAAGDTPSDEPARDNVHELASQLSALPDSPQTPGADVVSESDNALVRLINALIHEAIRRGASDIHVETADAPRQVRIRLRIDGELLPFIQLPPRLRFALVARIKIMADLDISEHRKPQDGKIDFARFGGPHVELRVVTVPTTRGLEDVVLRLLNGLKPMPLDQIGLSGENLRALRSVVDKPYGLILICGPTGFGKTTTLHSVLRDINTDGRKIWTAEDPVEITQDGLRQVQMNSRIGWTFAAAMRTFLRADPDVIMIGEMRDEETARIAIEASLTGHLVLSTLHTNSAPESIARLLEIGLDPFNFSDSLLAIPAPQQAALDAASVAVERLEQLGVQLQELARVLAGDGPTLPEAVDLAAAARQGVAEWAPVAARRGVHLHGPSANGEPLEVQVAAGVIEQLLDLAIDHAMRIGVRVEVGTNMQGQPARPMLTVQVQRTAAAAEDRDAIDDVHWLLFTVLARACGLTPQRVATGHAVVLMLGFPGHEVSAEGAPHSAALQPCKPIAADRQVLLLEPRELSRLQAHRLMHAAGMQVDAVATLDQARAALRDRTPDVFITGIEVEQGDCSTLIDELRAVQPRLRIIELVDDDSAFTLSLPGESHAGRVGRSDLARTLDSAISQELDAAWAGLE